MTDNLSDIPARREHPESRDAHGSLPATPGSGPAAPTAGYQQSSSTASIWLAIYFLTAVLCAAGAVLIARAVRATGMEAAAAGGGTFLAVLTLAITAHRFLRDR